MTYSKLNIMTNAWTIRKTYNVSMSVALRAAWAQEKAAQVAEDQGKKSGYNYRVILNDWAKGGKARTYVSTRIYTNAWHLKREYQLGYIDNLTGTFVAG